MKTYLVGGAVREIADQAACVGEVLAGGALDAGEVVGGRRVGGARGAGAEGRSHHGGVIRALGVGVDELTPHGAGSRARPG